MSTLAILKPEIQNYIYEKTGSDFKKLAFQKNPFPEVDFKIIINQIECRTKSKDKLETWFAAKNIIYPSKISLEQTSSEVTANYKSNIISGENLIDLSGGFGVDDFYFSKKVKEVIHCEINSDLSQIVHHNFRQLGILNVTCIEGNSHQTLSSLKKTFDWIYIDPSRRNDVKGKVFMLNDCLPNVPELQNFYYQYSTKILIKTAPILDITAGILELKNVKKIHIVAIENEVKELLWEIEKDYEDVIQIKTINFLKNKTEKFDFNWNSNPISTFSLPKKYIYEANSAIMKSGGFDEISAHFKLDKLHKHSHLYTADELIEFPGRTFEVSKVIEYSKPEMKLNIQNTKANVTIRNFPETVEDLRKKWKIKDGGNQYCFFSTDNNNTKIVLICTKINL